MNEADVIAKAKTILTTYLDGEPKYRKTQERFAILEMVYSKHTHFDIESLMVEMNRESKVKVSRATFYNTIHLLVECRLLNRLFTGDGGTKYEITLGVDPHFHLICTNCGCVQDYKNKRVKAAIDEVAYPRFKLEGYSLNIFGLCLKCNNKQKRESKQKELSLLEAPVKKEKR